MGLKGVPRSAEVKKKLSDAQKGKRTGAQNPNYKHGLYTLLGRKEYDRLSCKRYCAVKRYGGELSIPTIQLVYEDNIKKYGKLTCYLCLIPIEFGKDGIEHKIPASKGGTNLYENLEIACRNCNVKKRDKTETEYRESLKQEKT